MDQSPAIQVVDKAIAEIQALDQGLDAVNTNKLATDLWNLESMASALRSFILNHKVRTA
jgi:hypothetical protein